MKLLIILILGAILCTLGFGLYHLFGHREGSSDRLVTALTWRIGLSVALFGLLFVAWFLGLIEPASVPG